jgi:tyrosinase
VARVRRNVWSLQQPWDPILLWYARGVQALKARPFADITSWRYLAAIHGIEEEIWREFGWLQPAEQLPQTPEFQNQDRDQCQHHGWYFIPWHRGYLASFEAIVRAVIEKMPAAPKDWALPYWDYNKTVVTNPRNLPEAFARNTWPDGGDNPLFDKRRYGRGDGVVIIREEDVDLKTALREGQFEGVTNGSPGFGGVRTPFQHDADRDHEGWLEQVPHDVVHGLVGGSEAGRDPRDWRFLGLMSMPQTAGLDPIFWLHHANIDRMWDIWLKRDASHKNPTLSSWLNGPAGRHRFIVPQPDGTRKRFTPKDMLDTSAPALDYVYEDTCDPLGGQQRLSLRLRALSTLVQGAEGVVGPEVGAVAKKPKVELLGANAKATTLSNAPTSTTVKLDKRTARKVTNSFKLKEFAARSSPEPDRVFLNLENITGDNDAAVFDVYVGLPQGADPKAHPENRAGVVSLFGLRASTNMAKPHGGAGMTKVLEITDTIDRLHLSGDADLSQLPVLFVPVSNLGDGGISIKRVSIYRQAS